MQRIRLIRFTRRPLPLKVAKYLRVHTLRDGLGDQVQNIAQVKPPDDNQATLLGLSSTWPASSKRLNPQVMRRPDPTPSRHAGGDRCPMPAATAGGTVKKLSHPARASGPARISVQTMAGSGQIHDGVVLGLNQTSVPQRYDPVHPRRQIRVVGGDQRRQTVIAHDRQQFGEHGLGSRDIQVAGRLIGQ
jgi:hypothetical protein